MNGIVLCGGHGDLEPQEDGKLSAYVGILWKGTSWCQIVVIKDEISGSNTSSLINGAASVLRNLRAR